MSYCVHCGVELSSGEKQCPLCQTPVSNPNAPWQGNAERPYPRYLETVTKRIDRRYFAALASVLMLIPVLITLFCDWIADGGIAWAPYVAGGIALVYVCTVVPFFFRKPPLLLCLIIDSAALLLYLLLIETMHGGQWFLPLGLPIGVFVSAEVIALALLFRRKKRVGFLLRVGSLLLAAGLLVTAIDVIVSIFIQKDMLVSWALYALIPAALLAVATFVIDSHQKFKEEVRRRLFF